MKQKLIIITLLALMCMAMIPVQAQTITMSNPGGIAERDIIVYYPNGTMQGYYNSTSVITLDPNTSYIFTMKPLAGNPLDDPGAFLGTLFAFLKTNVIPLCIIGLLAGTVIVVSRR